jgi:NAD(P)-dependent dehydrogenase (short-subunit alcohol dehydrogenase family)
MYSPTESSFEGRVVIITGASSGLGQQLALDLAARQACLILADRNQGGLVQTAAALENYPTAVETCVVDVTVAEECTALIDLALKKYGRLDFLVLCAGISMWARFEDVSELSVFEKLMAVNYLGAVYCIHAALPSLKATRGTIVAISSLQGEVAIPRHTGYSASKHALNGFLEALELELGGQVRILNIMPGWITGTGLRANAFKVDGNSGGGGAKKGKASVSVQECSRLIIRSMQGTGRTLFVPRKLKALLWIKALAPSLLKKLVSRAVDAQE